MRLNYTIATKKFFISDIISPIGIQRKHKPWALIPTPASVREGINTEGASN